MRHIRWLCYPAVLVILIFCAGAETGRSQAGPASEYQVKAAFLFNFAKFIEWPPGSFAGALAPFSVCVLGEDPFGRVLDDALEGKVVGERRMASRRLKDKSEARGCQMVFVSSSERRKYPEIFGSVRGANVLLVGETRDFAVSGGTIEFTLEDNRVRFTINTDAAERAGLKFSSKLLTLARIVHDEGRAHEK